MKHLFLLLTLFVCQNHYSQFSFMRHSQEYKEPVIMIMNDGSERKGYVKNNLPQDVALRLLSVDIGSLFHANVIANTISFKGIESNSYETIPSETIRQVIFSGKENAVLDRLTIQEFKLKTQEIKDKESFNVFQEALYENETFKVYGTIYLNYGQGGHLMDHYRFFVKKSDDEITYIFPLTGMMNWNYLFKHFKIYGKDNPDFDAYLEILSDKKSEEFKSFTKAFKENQEQAKAEYKEMTKRDKSIKRKNERVYTTHQKFNFLFAYMGYHYRRTSGLQ